MPRASTPQSERLPTASSATERPVKRERESGGKDKGKSAEDIGMYLDRFLEDVNDLPSELQARQTYSVTAFVVCANVPSAQIQVDSRAR